MTKNELFRLFENKHKELERALKGDDVNYIKGSSGRNVRQK